jgi:alginate O-acetyltransferase complex protein AlgI
MVFSSPLFLFAFLPFALAACYAAPRGARNAVLLILSLAFYVWGECEHSWILLSSVAGNYVAGLVLSHCQSRRSAWWVVCVAIAANVLLLCMYKYAGFFANILNRWLHPFGVPRIDIADGRLPLGISFFTFQAIAYVVDVYRGHAAVERKAVNYSLYATLFPHLVAGPIVRYRDLAGQLANRTINLDQFASGVRRFALGLGKKVLIANTLAIAVDRAFDRYPNELAMSGAWLGLICYALQIYFDFSGYSDMAIGLGRMFGFEFLENFRHPYAAASVTEFWRRWHISLSSWLRDYVYIPLGGNRVPPWRVFANQLFVFALCGLWHGAHMRFVLWGVWHGAFVACERAGAGQVIARWPRPFRHAYTLLAVLGGWVFFRADSLKMSRGYFGALMGASDGIRAIDLLSGDIALALLIAIPACLPIGAWIRERLGERPWRPAAEVTFCGILLGFSTLALAAGSFNPFLYFRF